MSRADRPELELRYPDKTNAADYVETAMRGRLDDLALLIATASGGVKPTPERAAELGLADMTDEGDWAAREDEARERLYEYPLCVQTRTAFEVVLGTGGPDDRLIVECNSYEKEPGEQGWGSGLFYEILSILYRYTWSGSGEVVLSGEDFDTAEAFAREVVPELAE